MPENSPTYPSLFLEWDFNNFPICAVFLPHEILQTSKILPNIEEQSVGEARQPDSWSVMLIKKDIDLLGKVKKKR